MQSTSNTRGPAVIKSVTNHSRQLFSEGFLILDGLLPKSLIQKLNEELESVFANTDFCEGEFYGERTKRFGSLLRRSSISADLVGHPEIIGIAETVLGHWCDTIQLNLSQAIEIYPGALPQYPHRDQDMWRGPVGEIEYLVNVMWPLTAFTERNGATLIWPGTHGQQAHFEVKDREPIVAECEPGAAIVFLGSTLHGAGANLTTRPRRGVIVSYCLGWLKPYENQWLAYPPEVARKFSPDLAGLVGYRQHRPNLGNYEGHCPSILLTERPPARSRAVDALRPDQADAVRAFADQLRTGK